MASGQETTYCQGRLKKLCIERYWQNYLGSSGLTVLKIVSSVVFWGGRGGALMSHHPDGLDSAPATPWSVSIPLKFRLSLPIISILACYLLEDIRLTVLDNTTVLYTILLQTACEQFYFELQLHHSRSRERQRQCWSMRFIIPLYLIWFNGPVSNTNLPEYMIHAENS